MNLEHNSNILILVEILKNYTDENHSLSQKEILYHFENEYGIHLERKTIGNYLDTLEALGYDIIRTKKGEFPGVRLLSRKFDASMVKYLIDAIFSSKNITGKQAQELALALSSDLSKYQRRDYRYLYKSTSLNRNTDSDFFFNIEIINEAISQNKRISFQYASYDRNGNEILKANGYRYEVSPYYLVNNFGKYYLLCKYRNFDNITNFRIDYLRNVKITENSRPADEVRSMASFSIEDYINSHIYIFGGKVSLCKIEILQERAVTYVKDWFGKNAVFETEGDKTYASFQCDEKAFYYWCLQYGQDIRVIQPKSTLLALSGTYRSMAERYADVEKEDIAPDYEEILTGFFEHENFRNKSANDIDAALLGFLKKSITKTHAITKQENEFLIEGKEGKGLIMLFVFFNQDYLKNMEYVLFKIHELETNDSFHVKHICVLVRDEMYFAKDPHIDSSVMSIFKNTRNIIKGKEYKVEDRTLCFQKNYSLSWRGITSINDTTKYKYFILKV